VFCQHTRQQNENAAGAPPLNLLGELTALPQVGAYSAPPDLLAGFKGAAKAGRGRGKGEEGKRRRRAGRRGAGRERGGEVDSDTQLEQSRRLAKAGLVF